MDNLFNKANNGQCGFFIAESAGVPTIPKVIENKNTETVEIETILQDAEVPNRNKRIYSKKALEEALKHPQVLEKLNRKSFFGEANHPLTDDIKRQVFIDQTRMSHVVKNVWWENNTIKANVSTTNTACGRDMAGLIRQGTEVAFSMRGLGGVTRNENGFTIIESPLQIICYDWVLYPSHQEAYQQKILKEESVSTDSIKVLNEGIIFEIGSELTDYIKEESYNVKTSINQLELLDNSFVVNENFNSISLKQDDGKVVLFLEDEIKKELRSYFRK